MTLAKSSPLRKVSPQNQIKNSRTLVGIAFVLPKSFCFRKNYLKLGLQQKIPGKRETDNDQYTLYDVQYRMSTKSEI